MKIAFVGKGGSGKTTLAALVSRSLSQRKMPVLVFDADINQHLGQALGLSEKVCASIPQMGFEIDRIKEYLRGDNVRISSAQEMMKTTPPGTGSRLLTVSENNDLYDYFSCDANGVRLFVVGGFCKEDLGVKCYHAKTGSIELLLNHLVDGEREYVIVDMTAGSDSFASGLFTRFDVTFLVVEPTVQSVAVYQQYAGYAREYGQCIQVIGNKVRDASDVSFIRDAVGDAFVGAISDSDFVRSAERGNFLPIEDLEDGNARMIDQIISFVDAQEKDWDLFYDQAVPFHRKNAESWANASVGSDVAEQIDPIFSLSDAVARLQAVHAA